MGGIRRGIALAVALLWGAAPAMAEKGSSDASVRRQADLTPVVVQAIASGDHESSVLLRLSRTRDAAAAGPRSRGPRSEGLTDACSLGEHREVSST